MKKLAIVLLAAAVIVPAVLIAQTTVTNRGVVITQYTMQDITASDVTHVKTDWLPGDVATWVVAVDLEGKDAGAHTYGIEIPKGMILLENAAIEVTTAQLPTNSTSAVAVGGVTVATAANLTAGVKQAVAAPGATTAAGYLTVTVAGTNATAGEFVVYLPVVAGATVE